MKHIFIDLVAACMCVLCRFEEYEDDAQKPKNGDLKWYEMVYIVVFLSIMFSPIPITIGFIINKIILH